MELRQLISQSEKSLFAKYLVDTRKSKGAGFSETERSHVGEAHLQFGRLYALYDEEGPEPDEMLGGFVLHDLGSFPQSYPKPDMTQVQPEFAFECGELWAKAAGAARLVRQAAWILVGQLQAQAVLVYPIFKPWNLTIAYRGGFDRIGEPIEWPYARTLDGGKIFVQAMVSDGEKLQSSIREAAQYGFEAAEDTSRIRFNSPFQICTKGLRAEREGRLWRETPAADPMRNAA